MIFETVETLLTDDMFHTAGILSSGGRVDTERYEPFGKNGMLFIDRGGNLQAFVCQRYKAILIHDDIVVCAEILHSNTDT